MIYNNAFSLLAGKKMPIYVSENEAPCFMIEQGITTKPTFAFTIPKSGTYLIKEILEELEVVYCGHFSTFSYFDQRFGDLEEFRINPDKFISKIDISTSSRMIRNGQFGVGHIPPVPNYRKFFNRFHKIFCYRNLRNVIISCVKYYDKIDRRGIGNEVDEFKKIPMGEEKVLKWISIWGPEYSNLSKDMMKWQDVDRVLSVSFEDLVSEDCWESILEISKHMKIPISISESKRIAASVVGKRTVTSTNERSDYKKYWSREIEAQFVKLGFETLNSKFGYTS
ncbi:MAG: sulfotransferase domain-containing protein [Candidatus Thorarchaeota archaeon]|jgi:hypothetical protein